MKLVRRSAVLLMAAAVLASCGSTGAGPKQATEVLDHKGAAAGVDLPSWVTASIAGGNIAVEALPEFNGLNCFVVSVNDANRDFAIRMAESTSGPAAVAQMVSTTVSANAQTKAEGTSGGEGVSAEFREAAEAMSNASFTGLRKNADWWMVVRNTSTDVQETRAYVLYTIDSSQLSNQIAYNLANIVENNYALSEAEREIYNDLIAEIRSGGFRQ